MIWIPVMKYRYHLQIYADSGSPFPFFSLSSPSFSSVPSYRKRPRLSIMTDLRISSSEGIHPPKFPGTIRICRIFQEMQTTMTGTATGDCILFSGTPIPIPKARTSTFMILIITAGIMKKKLRRQTYPPMNGKKSIPCFP